MDNAPTVAECLARVREVIHPVSSPPARAGVLDSGHLSEDQFDELARTLFAFQFQHNPVLRRLCESRGVTPAKVASWREVPALSASAFKEFEVTTLPASERVAVFHSSGTTGQRPSRHFHSAASLALYEASLLAWFKTHLLGNMAALSAGAPGGLGVSPLGPPRPPVAATAPVAATVPVGLNLICLTPPPAHAPHSSLVHMMETVRRGFAWERAIFLGRVGADQTWAIDLQKLVSLLEQSVRAGVPLAVLGTAFSYVEVLDHLSSARLEFQLPPGSRIMETGGYKGRSRALPKAELHDRITRFLGIPACGVISEYGMSELGSQAYDARIQCGTGSQRVQRPTQPQGDKDFGGARLFRFPPWARVRLISPETGREVADGETGLIRVCDLANVCSVIALQTEDLAVRRQDGFELLGRAAGAEPRGCSLQSA